jgi:hypothetical protein
VRSHQKRGKKDRCSRCAARLGFNCCQAHNPGVDGDGKDTDMLITTVPIAPIVLQDPFLGLRNIRLGHWGIGVV